MSKSSILRISRGGDFILYDIKEKQLLQQKDLIDKHEANDKLAFEQVTLSNGDKVYIRALNSVSDQARKNINHTYNNFIKMGKL